MRFTLVLVGIMLLIVGLATYSFVPNTHTVPIRTSQSIVDPQTIQVGAGFLSETSENVSTSPDKQNELRVNVTVSLESGELSSVEFKLFTKDKSQNCMSVGQSSSCLVNRSVSNETLRVPVNASTVYYFAFDNTGSSSSKRILFSASLFASTAQTFVTKDGSLNFLGLGLGGIGFLVVLYGASRKTVIPWE